MRKIARANRVAQAPRKKKTDERLRLQEQRSLERTTHQKEPPSDDPAMAAVIAADAGEGEGGENEGEGEATARVENSSDTNKKGGSYGFEAKI